MKNCLICNKLFEPLKRNKKALVCSRSCNASLQNKKKKETFISPSCKNCGKETRRTTRAVFCSSVCQKEWNTGENHYNWKGGRKKSGGYIFLLRKDHPFSDKCGYILEHRLLMEDYLRENNLTQYMVEVNGIFFLNPKSVVHHKNNIKNDNRIENLELLSSQSIHVHKKGHIANI